MRLTDRGRRQIGIVAERLAGCGVNRPVTSTVPRALARLAWWAGAIRSRHQIIDRGALGRLRGLVTLVACRGWLGVVADPNGSDVVFRLPLPA